MKKEKASKAHGILSNRDDLWPGDTWPCSTPEEQGVDSRWLLDMLKVVKSRNIGIDGLLVIRNGRLIMEMYRYPYKPDTIHHVYSCTKSFMSALIGIAIAQGKIKGPYQRIEDFFSDRRFAHFDKAKLTITLANLLTMSSGYEWPGGMLEQPTLHQWWQSPDWVQYVLDRPLSDPPGIRFVYNTGCSHLLSAILQRSVGMNTEAFAKSELFPALGIKDWHWQADPQGITTGGFGLWLRPRDMAKLGSLYLNAGRWNRRQIVPAEWVAESTRQHIEAGAPWLSDGYGYHWWVDGQGYYMALGFAGQYIVVIPERNLIMVTAGCLSPNDFFVPESLLRTYLLPGSRASAALPPNSEAREELNACILELAGQDKNAVPSLLPMAFRISGKTFVRRDDEKAGSSGPPGWKTASLVFTEGGESAFFIEDGESMEIGLDGRYRVSTPYWGGSNPPFPRSALDLGRGYWKTDNEFIIEHFLLGDGGRFVDTFRFEDDALVWRQESPTYGNSRTIKGLQRQPA